MSIGAKIAGLSVVTVPVVGLANLHWVVSHFSTIATGAAAITVGAGVWGGHALVGKVKLQSEERKAAKAAVKAAKAQGVQYVQQLHAAPAQPYTQQYQAAPQRQVIDLGRAN
jgi:uncharacterized membrane protein